MFKILGNKADKEKQKTTTEETVVTESATPETVSNVTTEVAEASAETTVVDATVAPQGFQIKEVNADLLKAPKDAMIAHCITADYSLGAGLAKQIDDKFDMRYELFYNYDIPLGKKYVPETVGKALKVKQVYNLVTKEEPQSRATYDNLESALKEMRDDMVQNDYKKLYIPKLGCGRDKLRWDKVKPLIEEVFKDTDIEITVCEKENNKKNG